MKTTYWIVIGILIALIGGLSSIYLSVYSLFVSIPIAILGFCIIGFRVTKICINKIVIASATIIAVYYSATYVLMIQSQALI